MPSRDTFSVTQAGGKRGKTYKAKSRKANKTRKHRSACRSNRK